MVLGWPELPPQLRRHPRRHWVFVFVCYTVFVKYRFQGRVHQVLTPTRPPRSCRPRTPCRAGNNTVQCLFSHFRPVLWFTFLPRARPSRVFTLDSRHCYPQLRPAVRGGPWSPRPMPEFLATPCPVAANRSIRCPGHMLKLSLVEPSSYISFCQNYVIPVLLRIPLTPFLSFPFAGLILRLCLSAAHPLFKDRPSRHFSLKLSLTIKMVLSSES